MIKLFLFLFVCIAYMLSLFKSISSIKITKISCIVIFLVSNLVLLNAAVVNIDADVYAEYTLFTYTFNFSEDDSYRSFSFERPSDAQLDFVKDKLGEEVKYSVAGDYYILQPSKTNGEIFDVRFTSKKVSAEIFEKGSFGVYTNFNFLVDELNFKFKLIDEIGTIESYFPRDYKILDDGSIAWSVENLGSEELFRVEFSNIKGNSGISKSKFWTDNRVIIIAGIVLFTVLILIVFFVVYTDKLNLKFPTRKLKKESKMIKITKVVEDKPEEETVELQTYGEGEESPESAKEGKTGGNNGSKFLDKEKYAEIHSKFLTENEKNIVDVIKDNEGISQNDILNFLPTMTKSNLSKIISKLNNKQILKRIRVGKINKIYLGSRLEKSSNNTKEDNK